MAALKYSGRAPVATCSSSAFALSLSFYLNKFPEDVPAACRQHLSDVKFSLARAAYSDSEFRWPIPTTGNPYAFCFAWIGALGLIPLQWSTEGAGTPAFLVHEIPSAPENFCRPKK